MTTDDNPASKLIDGVTVRKLIHELSTRPTQGVFMCRLDFHQPRVQNTEVCLRSGRSVV